LILIPESWLKYSFRRPFIYLAAVLAALAAYLAAQHGCIDAQEHKGGTDYAPAAAAVLAYAIAALTVISSSYYSRLARLITLVTFPAAVFFVPALAVGVLQDMSARVCTAAR
jgi:hypothetical protein